MLSKGLKIRPTMTWCASVFILVSQLALASSAVANEKELSQADDLSDTSTESFNHSQSVLKSTDENEITIKLNNNPPKLALAQNTPKVPISSAEQTGLFRIYRSNLLKKTYQHVIYPESAIDRNQQGDVVLKLTINRKGEIQDVKYDKRADFSSLNKAAARAVKNAKPYPAAPKRLNGESFEVIMPIRFRLAG